VKVSGPNDEALPGHLLYRYGLKHYSIHRIDNSPWIAELEQQNSVHPQHSRAAYLRNKVHYLFALKEEVVECIVTEPPNATFEVFDSRAAAIQRASQAIEA
jgi:hypothetical protein